MAGSIDGKNAAENTASAPKPSPAEMLKQAVSGPAAAPVIRPHGPAPLRLDLRSLAVAATALVIGTAVGVVAAPRDRSDGVSQIQAVLDAGRAETARLGSEIEKTSRTLAALREAAEAARAETTRQAGTVTERIGRLEQGLAAKVATLGERIDQAERDHAVRLASLTAQIEKRPPAAPAPVAPPAPTVTAKSDPTQTGSIVEPKPAKPDAVENWALRDVYDGVAMLEDRKRHLMEVAPGDMIPGVGRVEGIERRGRSWVVVTKLGLITPQTW